MAEPVKLDIVIPTYNRPRLLERAVKSSLLLGLDDYHVVVIDDGSTKTEELADGTRASTPELMERYRHDPRVRYIRHEVNGGLGTVHEAYATRYIGGDYAIFINDDDVFIDPEPIHIALAKMEADASLAICYMSLLRRSDDGAIDQRIKMPYPSMTGADFFRIYSADYDIRHTSIYGMFRTRFIRETEAMRSMGLQKFGLHDAFGIDTDLVFRLLTKGNVDFVDQAYIMRRETAGLTERFPLTFAYTYYQYILRAMRYQKSVDFVEERYHRQFLMTWYHIMLMMYDATLHSPVAEEKGEMTRVRRHLRVPFHVYLLYEMARHGIFAFANDDARRWFKSTWAWAWQNRTSTLGYLFNFREKPNRVGARHETVRGLAH